MNGIDWDKFSTLVRDTELNLERAKDKLGSVRSIGLRTYDFKTDAATVSSASQVYGGSLRFQQQFQPSSTSSSLSRVALPPSASDVTVAGFSDVGHSPADVSPSIVSLLNDKIDTQAKTIDGLMRSLQRNDEEREVHIRQMQELRDEMSRLRGRVAERGVDLATEQKVTRWQQESSSELQSVQSQIQSLRSRTEEFGSKNSALATALLELQRFVNSECDYLRREINSLKNKIGTIEAEVGSIAVSRQSLDGSRPSHFRQSNHELSTRDAWHSSSSNGLLQPPQSSGLDAKNSVSFFTPPFASSAADFDTSRLAPGSSELTRLRSSYRDLQKKVSSLENQLLIESGIGRSSGRQPSGRSSNRRGPKSALRRSSESCDQTSPATTDFELDLSTATNLTARSAPRSRQHFSASQSFDDFLQSTDALSDMSSDGGNSLTLDDL